MSSVSRVAGQPALRALAGVVITLGACGTPSSGGGDTDSSGIPGGSGTGATEGSGGGGGPEKLDVGGSGSATGGGGDCPGGGMGGEYDFSIIWISNTGEGTVSKIDTKSATELARYRTGPAVDSDPSRTSVNLLGDVAVGNRSGSVTKIASEVSRCIDTDGDGTILTSQGPTDILEWGQDECVLWHHDIPEFPDGLDSNQGGPRAVAWDAGTLAEDPCTAKPNLWIGWRHQPDTYVVVRQLDGETGAILGEVQVPDWTCAWGHGTYGGATDRDGAFWGLGTLGTLVRVEPGTFAATRWDMQATVNPYGLALDAAGSPWMAGYDGKILHFDPTTEQWEDLGTTGNSARLRGLAIDDDGQAWIAGNSPCGLIRYDLATRTVIDGAIPLAGCSEPVGVSIDVDGFVWVVDRDANRAYKVDPTNYTAVTVENLVTPYTYSDMTGSALKLVNGPPQG